MTFVLASIFLVAGCNNPRFAHIQKAQCHGNIETFDRRLIQADANYWISYKIYQNKATVWFAGREFEADIEQNTANAWRGYWLFVNDIDENLYFSYLPQQGGEMRFMFEPTVWFSGSCL